MMQWPQSQLVLLSKAEYMWELQNHYKHKLIDIAQNYFIKHIVNYYVYSPTFIQNLFHVS